MLQLFESTRVYLSLSVHHNSQVSWFRLRWPKSEVDWNFGFGIEHRCTLWCGSPLQRLEIVNLPSQLWRSSAAANILPIQIWASLAHFWILSKNCSCSRICPTRPHRLIGHSRRLPTVWHVFLAESRPFSLFLVWCKTARAFVELPHRLNLG